MKTVNTENTEKNELSNFSKKREKFSDWFSCKISPLPGAPGEGQS